VGAADGWTKVGLVGLVEVLPVVASEPRTKGAVQVNGKKKWSCGPLRVCIGAAVRARTKGLGLWLRLGLGLGLGPEFWQQLRQRWMLQ